MAGLIFLTLPLAFNEIAGGYVFAGLFFILLAFAAITALSLLEPSVAWMIENKNYRGKSAIIIGFSIWILGFLSIFSFNILSEFISGKELYLIILTIYKQHHASIEWPAIYYLCQLS